MGTKWLALRDSIADLLGSRPRNREDARKHSHRRSLRIEQFESRVLLSITAPDLVAVLTPDAAFQPSNSPVLNVAPKEITFRFSEGRSINPTTLAGIQITRAGTNGLFYDPVNNPNDIDDVVIAPGWVGIGSKPNEVIVRLAENLPDDLYHITFVGQGTSNGNNAYRGPDGKVVAPLKDTTGASFRLGTDPTHPGEGQNFVWNFRLDLSPQVVAVTPQPIKRESDGTLSQSRNTIDVYFSAGDEMLSLSGTRTVDSSGVVHGLLDTRFFQLIDTRSDDAQQTPDSQYNTIGGTATPNDDVWINPTSVAYTFDQATGLNKAVLTFSDVKVNHADGTQDPSVQITDLSQFGTGAIRLRIGDQYQAIETTASSPDNSSEVGSSYSTSYDVTSNLIETGSSKSVVLGGEIEPLPYGMEFPGDRDEPGHRDLPANIGSNGESHIFAGDADTSSTGTIDTYTYAFPTTYSMGTNLITESQKESVRQMFALFQNYFGVQFAEVVPLHNTDATGDISIILGDPRALNTPAGPGGVAGVATVGPGMVVIDSADFSSDDGRFGGGFWTVAMHEILHNLNLAHTYDMPAITVMGSGEDSSTTSGNSEPVYPGAIDIIHGQLVHRPDSIDIDLYKFTATEAGTFSAETIAERLAAEANPSVSLLDTAITIFDANYNVVARNDDYFSKDSFLNVHLAAGTYYVGVSAKGNNVYDPAITDSGIGGTTQGDYKLRLNYTPDVITSLTDTTGQALDGDLDGKVGGNYNFWFNVQEAAIPNDPSRTVATTIFVDKLASPSGDGTQLHPYQNLRDAFAAAKPGDIVRVVGNNTENDFGGNAFQMVDAAGADITGAKLTDGQTFSISDGTLKVTFEFDTGNGVRTGNVAVRYKSTDSAATIATAIVNAINSTSRSTARPLYVQAQTVVVNGKPVVVLNGPQAIFDHGTSPLTDTLQDNIAYQIGRDQYGAVLADGDSSTGQLQVPYGVTLMIDAGAVFKLSGANIDVGSSMQGVDRSLGALQVLGTPDESVYFTSFRDKSIGKDTYGGQNAQTAGDWGGLVFRNDQDYAEGHDVLETNGIFLNYVNHADIRYGGGSVSIGSVSQAYSSIYMDEARPTITFNAISYSADAALSADPNSFMESKFEGNGIAYPYADTYSGPYTVDYDRVGPEMRGNVLKNNTINGMFVRVQDQASSPVDKLEVSARFDDTDIVYVISSNLLIDGNPGGPVIATGDSPLTQAGPQELQAVDGNAIAQFNYAGSPYFTVGNTTKRYEFEFTGNWLVVSDGKHFSDGDMLTIKGHKGTTAVTQIFEFDTGNGVAAGHVAIHFSATDSIEQMMENIATAINNDAAFEVVAAPGSYGGLYGLMTLAGYDDQITDPVMFTASNPNVVGLWAYASMDVSPGRIPVAITLGDSAEMVAQAIAAAINSTDLFSPNAAKVLGSIVSIQAPTVLFDGLSKPTARLHGRLAIDPGVIVKLDGSRIEAETGAQLLAEGTPENPIIFTSLSDNTYGAGGTFATSNNTSASPHAGDWSSLYFGPVSTGSIDNAKILYGGGSSPIEGDYANFDVVEVHQAKVRIANTLFKDNAGNSGSGGQDADRNGRGYVTSATIFVRGAQPVIVNNTFVDNLGPMISIDCNSMTADIVADWGRSTGYIDVNLSVSDSARPYVGFEDFSENHGVLVHGNRMTNNGVNGMVIRGGGLTTETIWDDTDIVHVLYDEIVVPNFHTYGGIRLQSSTTESLVVKLRGANAGLTASGRPLEIADRIGGTVQVIGMPGHAVIMTSLADDSVGAGYDLTGKTQVDTDNVAQNTTNRPDSVPQAGDWHGIILEKLSNDRNVAVTNETEDASQNVNATSGSAQGLGQIDTTLNGGDENKRLGLEVHGYINTPTDVDTYSFQATAGTEVWINIDKTLLSLDTVLELVDATGKVVAYSDNKLQEEKNSSLYQTELSGNLARTLRDSVWTVRDFYSINPRDAGMRLVLPGPAGQSQTYFVRVSSKDHLTSGAYRLQVRLRQTDEVPGSTIHGASIYYATNAIEMLGFPVHSPIVNEAQSVELNGGSNNTFDTAQDLGNLLGVDRGTLNVGGYIQNATDVNWYKFSVDLGGIQRIANVSGTGSMWPTIFDVDYADGMSRPDLTLWVFDDQGRLILTSTDSKIADDLTGAATGTDASDLSAGSFGLLDPFIGPAFLPESGRTYYVAVSCPGAVADAFNQALLRREPMESVDRVVEDHINDVTLGSRPAAELTSIELTPSEFNLSDVVMYVCIGNDLYTYNPLTGALETDVTSVGLLPDYTTLSYGDIAMRNDGKLFTFTRSPFNNSAGLYRQLDTGDARTLVSSAATGINTYKPDPTDEKGIKEIPLDMPGGLSVEAMVEGLGNVDRGVLAVGNVPPETDSPYVKNLLYRFDDNGKALDYPGNDGTERLPTNIVPLAQLLTAGTFTVTKATQSIYTTNSDILDGTLCTVNLANGSTKVFEFDCGPDIRLSTGLTAGANLGFVGAQAVRDGQTFTLSGKTYEFNSGPVLTFGAGSSIKAGDVVTLSDGTSLIKLVFQDKKGPIPADADMPAGAIAVQYATSDSAATIMDAVIKAINEAGTNLVATGFVANGKARVSIQNDQDMAVDNLVTPGGATGVKAEGKYGNNVSGSTNVLINFEESQSATDFMAAIEAAVEANSPGVTVEWVHRDSYTADPLSGDRITFYGATNADFRVVSSFYRAPNAHGGDSGTGVGSSNVQVIFGADDTMEEIADALRRAMESALPGVTVTVTGGQVEITGAASVAADAPFTSAGSGPGGYVTGMAYVGNTLYAVSDAGGFYVVNNAPTTNILTDTDYGFMPVGDGSTTRKEIAPTGHGPSNSWINSPALAGFKFSGLTQGPQNVENSRYKDLLFATTTDGKLVCFDTTGKLQAVFAGGQSSIQLSGLGGNVTGVAFSTLDYNLWHESNTRALDEGHGINTTYDSTRNSANDYTHATGEDRGLTSFYFGLENPTTVSAFNGPVNTSDQPDSMNYYYTNPSVYGTYNLPGGAMGSLVSQKSFSLKGYTAADVPRLYFDYYLDTENSTSFDGARVFVSTDDGATWNLVATNTDWDSRPLREDVVQPNGGVQLTSNGGTWRQAVVELGSYAGQDNIRLRFDFSTSSDFEIGDAETGGSYIEALAGNQLNDGLLFSIGGKAYEFDMGYSLNVPNAAGLTIPDGEQFTIVDGSGHVQAFEFDNNAARINPNAIAISINSSMTTMDVATAIQTAITTAVTNGKLDATVTATISTKQVDNTGAATNAVAVMIADAVGLTQTRSSTSTYTAMTVVGNGAGNGSNPLVELVRFRPGDTAAQVAQSIQQVVDPSNTSLKVDGALIHVYHLDVASAGPMSFSDTLQGDHPGEKVYAPDRYHNFQRGQNNAHEGFYIDDIIVGFAERGELITGATTDTTFNPVPTFNPAEQVPAGYYQMEIREATPYGTWKNGLSPYFTNITNTIDTNDRLNQSISLMVPSVTDLHHLDAFQISDGITTVTFRFVAQYNGKDLPGFPAASGNIPIRYTGTETAEGMATLIANAINKASQISHLFDVTAAVSCSLQLIRIDLFGAASVTSMSIYGKALAPDVTGSAGDATSTVTDLSQVKAPNSLGFDGKIAALGSSAAGTGVDYLNFDNWGGTWSDADKDIMPGDGDDLMCWAAAASNVLQWTGWGLVAGMDSSDEMFQYFQDHWTDMGGLAYIGWDWWFDGTNSGPTGGGWSQVDVPGGGFYEGLVPDDYIHTRGQGSEAEAKAMSDIDQYSRAGYGVALGIFGTIAHAITCWGFNYDDTLSPTDPNYYKGVYITDSDDYGPSDSMDYYAVTWDAVSEHYDFDSYYAGAYIGEVDGLEERPLVSVTVFDGLGDENLQRDQGQVIIDCNQIMYSKDYGIVVAPDNRDTNSNFAHPGSPAPLLSGDSAGLVPGISIINNVIAFGDQGGIHISGDSNTAGLPESAIPFVRVVNNTIYGNGPNASNVGVKIDTNAAATLLNNVVANFAQGITADLSSTNMVVVGETAYQNNKANVSGLSNEGSFAIDISSTDPKSVFVDPQHGIFYPAKNSPIIDSSLNWLADRPALTAVRSQLGIPQSPIIAPNTDMYGHTRIDNPNVANANGLGQNVFKDRGAIDYIDFAGPTASLINPLDGGEDDTNPTRNEVQLSGTTLPPTEFLIQLNDGTNGSGIDDKTVTSSAVSVYRDKTLLVNGQDYFFNYNADTDTIQLKPVGELPWYADYDYTITLRDTIKDTVGNSIDADSKTFVIYKTPLPEIIVEGLGRNIADGDLTPSVDDGTDFGSRIAQNGAAPRRTFTVRNTGKADLTLGILDLPEGFTLVEALDTTLAAGQSDTFTVELRTDVAKTYDGYISFTTNDADENPFYFKVTGTVLTPPEIVVEGLGQNIANGDSTPDSVDGTNFGSTRQGTSPLTRTFTVYNRGSADLTLNTLILPTGFTLTEALNTTILAGQSDTFTVKLSTASPGTFAGEISFTTNDADENPFHFAVTGTVSAAPVVEVAGLGHSIANGDSTPSDTDGTNFGSAKQNGAKLTRTFTVYNRGSADLTLNTLVLPTGFTLTEALNTTILAGQSDTFIVEVGTANTGTFAGEISFTTNDLDNPKFRFAVMATVSAAPKIVVKGGESGNVIADGDQTPSIDDGTDFGSAQENAASLTRTFTVWNMGTDVLTLGTPTVSSGSGYTITKWCNQTIAIGGSDTFTVALSTATVGTFVGDISFTTNDTDATTFDFRVTGTVTARLRDFETIGLYDRSTSTFYLRNTNNTAAAEIAVAYGPANGGWLPLVGDWNGDGIDTIGLYDPASSAFHLRSTNDAVAGETTVTYGPANGGWMPLVGDWNGDGTDTIGLYDRSTSTFYLKNANDSGAANVTFVYGPISSGWLPVVGDWNGDGTDTIGLYDRVNSRFYLKNTNDSADANVTFVYGSANNGWIPIVGDWNGDSRDTIGLHDPFASVFYLKNTNDSATADVTVAYGSANSKWMPLAGDWDGNHKIDISLPAVSASDNTYTDKVRVVWNTVPSATSYEVWRNTANNLSTAGRITSTTQTSYTDTTAVAGTQYWYWLKAKDSTGTSIFSASDPGRRQTLPATTPAKVYNAIEGNNTKTQVLATFSYANRSAAASNFTPTVTWGGTVVGTPAVSLQLVSRTKTVSNWKVVGSAVYADNGTYGITVSIRDKSNNVILSSGKVQFKVADARLTNITPSKTYKSVEGNSTGTQVLAIFKDANPFAPLSDYKATVNWGGAVFGTPTVSVQFVSRSATISTWRVLGSAVYQQKGSYTVSVSVKDVSGSTLSIRNTKFSVADAPLVDATSKSTYNAIVGKSTGSQVLATFTDANPHAPSSDYKVTVNWGGTVKGTPSVSVQFVSRTAKVSTWQVVGAATYAKAGAYAVQVKVADVHGSSVTIKNKISFKVAALLTAAGPAAASVNAPALTSANLQPIVSEALARWAKAGLAASAIEKLTHVEFVLADLPGSELGEAVANRVYIDRNAAGHGWFIDSTPALDEEFRLSSSNQRLEAVDPRAVDQIDLLTVVEHELGHIAGFDDLDVLADNLMCGELGNGIRRNAYRDHIGVILASE